MVKHPPPPTSKSPPSSWFQQQWARRLMVSMLVWIPVLCIAGDSFAKPLVPSVTTGMMGNPLQLIALLGAMALLPFLLMMITSFVKIAVVLSIVRSALGTQQNPPTQVITGMAIILTVYVMMPVGMEVYDNVKPLMKEWKDGADSDKKRDMLDPKNIKLVDRFMAGASGPIKRFLSDHSHMKERNMFYSLALQLQHSQELKRQRSLKGKKRKLRIKPRGISMNDLIILIPSFVISELKEAFQIGFLIFLPFIVVDMVVANILLALGMHMLSPTTISLPFKLLLFVLVDGWYLITKGIILGYI